MSELATIRRPSVTEESQQQLIALRLLGRELYLVVEPIIDSVSAHGHGNE